jgi:magnesium chelatase family protein
MVAPPWNIWPTIQGQGAAKRAMTIAAAGGHNALLVGPPGSGKTMLARGLRELLPPMGEQEALMVTRIHSVGGHLQSGQALIAERPFRQPHHTSSVAALVGGGRVPKPGELSLAHHGILFLDEFAEFSREHIEAHRHGQSSCRYGAVSSRGYVGSGHESLSLWFPTRSPAAVPLCA